MNLIRTWLPTAADYPEKRLFSLDVLRGLDMFLLIMVGPFVGALQRAYACFSPGFMQAFRHAWLGFTLWDIIMPLLTLYFAFTFPAAIGIYWIYQSLLGLLQSFILAKIMPLPTFTDEEIREMQKAAKRRATEMKAAPSPHSLHHIDDDDDDSNVVIPEIRSKYDEDGESTYAGVNETMKTPKKKNNASKKHPKKKKK